MGKEILFFLLLSNLTSTRCLQTPAPQSAAELLNKVQWYLDKKNADKAFATLTEIYQLDPTFPGMQSKFESCLRLQVEIDGSDIQARFGLVSLLLDQERFEEASEQLRHTVDSDDPYIREKSAAQLFRTNSAMCNWETVVRDGKAMVSSLKLQERSLNTKNPHDVPLLHPFEALKWPCISLSDSTGIAALYARRAMAEQGFTYDHPLRTRRIGSSVDVVNSLDKDQYQEKISSRKIRLGYISPDFTATHPMAFLIHSIFQHHDRDKFLVNTYFLGRDTENSPEVDKIKDGSDNYTVLSLGESPAQLAEEIRRDDLDILVDLCGYTGTSKVAELLSHRPCDVQIAYMGFPSSSGAPFIDYMIADQIVVPPSLRVYYTEGMLWMPNCYFVNSHALCAKETLIRDEAEYLSLRDEYNLPANSFVFCAHNRPDKIDCKIFQVWLEALTEIRKNHDQGAVLWMLRSGKEMEKNLRTRAREEFGLSHDALVFCDVAPREAHLRRLGCADVFLDTPSYNAHTVGCDTLFAGVPMISLLRPDGAQNTASDPYFVATEKLASRVGASLLSSVGLQEFITPDLESYKAVMLKCATNEEWFRPRARQLADNRFTSPLFDSKRWVRNLEVALCHIVLKGGKDNDVLVEENSALHDSAL